MSATTVHIFPSGRAWKVRVDGVPEEPIDTLCTIQRAIEHALEKAERMRRYERDVVVQIEQYDSEPKVLAAGPSVAA